MGLTKNARVKIIGKAAADAEFRARLLSDPKGAIEQTFGVAVPASMTIEVHEADASTAHLILPPSGKLGAEELEMIAAGSGGGPGYDVSFGPLRPPPSPPDDWWFDGGITVG